MGYMSFTTSNYPLLMCVHVLLVHALVAKMDLMKGYKMYKSILLT